MAKAQKRAKPKKTQHGSADTDAIATIKASGILNSDVTLEQILKVTQQMDATVGASSGGTVFVYPGFVYSPCVPILERK